MEAASMARQLWLYCCWSSGPAPAAMVARALVIRSAVLAVP